MCARPSGGAWACRSPRPTPNTSLGLTASRPRSQRSLRLRTRVAPTVSTTSSMNARVCAGLSKPNETSDRPVLRPEARHHLQLRDVDRDHQLRRADHQRGQHGARQRSAPARSPRCSGYVEELHAERLRSLRHRGQSDARVVWIEQPMYDGPAGPHHPGQLHLEIGRAHV